MVDATVGAAYVTKTLQLCVARSMLCSMLCVPNHQFCLLVLFADALLAKLPLSVVVYCPVRS